MYLITEFKGEFSALLAALLWAIASVMFAHLGRFFSSIQLNLIKGVVAFFLIFLTVVPGGELSGNIQIYPFLILLLSGVIGIGLGDTAYFESLKYIGARRALLVQTISPPLAAFIALIFLDEKLAFNAWLGILITISGVAWVITDRTGDAGRHSSHLLRGVAFALLAALGQASGAVISHAVLINTEISPLFSTLIRLAGGIIVLLFWIPFYKGKKSIRKIENKRKVFSLTFLAIFIGTYLGLWLLQISLKYADVGISQTLVFTSPIFIIPIAARMGEKISPRAVFGALIALTGIALLFLKV